MIMSQVVYPFYRQWLFGLFPCFHYFKQCGLEHSVCVSPATAHVQELVSLKTLAAHQNYLEGLLNQFAGLHPHSV